MSPRQKARLAFLSALILLVACGVAASVTIVRFSHTAKWISHGYDVQLALGDLQSNISVAARIRTNYLNTGEESGLAPYSAMKTQVHQSQPALSRSQIPIPSSKVPSPYRSSD